MLSKQLFIENITVISELVNKEISKAAIKAYYLILQDMSDDDFKKAVARIMSSRKFTSMPMPADFLESVQGDSDAIALSALVTIEDAIRKHGAYPTLIFSDPIINAIIERVDYDGKRSWAALCAIPLDEFKWWKKDFDKMYKAFVHGNVPVSRPLVGLLSSDEVVFIGDHDKCKALMDESNKADSVMKRLEG